MPIANGTYRITNLQFPGSAVDLNAADAYSPITGYPTHPGPHAQTWTVRNIDTPNNRFLIENATTPGSFASVGFQVEGSSLAGSPNATVWIGNEVAPGVYNITTPDGNFTWYLISDVTYARIILKPVGAEIPTNAQWTFGPA